MVKRAGAKQPTPESLRASGVTTAERGGVFDQLFGGVPALVVRAGALITGICHIVNKMNKTFALPFSY